MRWKMSDLFSIIIAISLTINLSVIILVLSRKRLERYFDMRQLSCRLKQIILYLLSVPVITTCLTYIMVVPKPLSIVQGNSEELRLYLVKNQTIGRATQYGNSIVFVIIAAVWFAGFLFFGVRYWYRSSHLLRKLEIYSKNQENCDLVELMEQLREEIGVKFPVELVISEVIEVPFVQGLRRIKIFVPKREWNPTNIRMILGHELTHCKNNDYFYRRLIFWLCAIYWFNPFLSFFADYFIEVNEMACDETLLLNKDEKEKKRYIMLLAETALETSFLANEVSLTGYRESSIERRIYNIMKDQKRVRSIPCVLLSAIVIAACPLSALAATSGTVRVQDRIAREIRDLNTYEEEQTVEESYVEEVETQSREARKVVKRIHITPRAAATVVCDLDYKDSMVADTVEMPASSTIRIILEADNTSDHFKAGIEGEGTTRSVSSKNGSIDYKFHISKAGSYDIFIESTSSNTIHVEGSIITR